MKKVFLPLIGLAFLEGLISALLPVSWPWPPLLLGYLVPKALDNGAWKGLWWGIGLGLAADIVHSPAPGPLLLSYLIVGYLLGRIGEKFVLLGRGPRAIMGFLAAILAWLVLWLPSWSMGENSFLLETGGYVLLQGVMTTITAWFFAKRALP